MLDLRSLHTPFLLLIVLLLGSCMGIARVANENTVSDPVINDYRANTAQ